ncbi:Eisosome component PIL1-domain-containing protein [Phycomyces nitens]|nr:Eisosome component PIL1-domain-containing protein [Phycomyces nitens]
MFSFKPFYHLTRSSQEDRSLPDLLNSEKKVISLLGQLADERRVANANLIRYGNPLGDDLADVTKQLGNLLDTWSTNLTEFAGNCEQYRETIKSIGERDSMLTEVREKKKRLAENIAKLQDNSPDSVDKIADLKKQLADLVAATEEDEVEISNFKRVAARESLYLLLNGMHELAGKTDIISSFGKYIVDELDVTPIKTGQERPPYKGIEKTARIVKDATHAITNWKPDKAKVRRTLTSHHGRNPLITTRISSLSQEKDLPPVPSAEGVSAEEAAENSAECLTESEVALDAIDVSDNSDSLPEADEESAEKPKDTPPSRKLLQIKPQSIRKPDDPNPSQYPDPYPRTNGASQVPELAINDGSSNVPLIPSLPPSGFSHVYLGLPDHQKLYQFYQQYTPPKTYEEMAQSLGTHAIFNPSHRNSHPGSPNLGPRADPGGFVRPTSNPNYINPQASISTSSVSSFNSSGIRGIVADSLSVNEDVDSESHVDTTTKPIVEKDAHDARNNEGRSRSRVTSLLAKFQN